METSANPMSPANTAAADAAPTPDQEAERRYLAAIDELVNHAFEHRRMHVLGDALAWTSARLIVGFGTPAAGDLLRRRGGYIADLAAQRRAEEEAEREKRAGRPLQ